MFHLFWVTIISGSSCPQCAAKVYGERSSTARAWDIEAKLDLNEDDHPTLNPRNIFFFLPLSLSLSLFSASR